MSFQLETGWNLLSLYLVPPNPDINEILADVKDHIVSVWKWVDNKWAVSLSGYNQAETDAYLLSKGFSQLTDISCGEGFWINSLISQPLTIPGTQPPDPSFSLKKGWNLIGLKNDEKKIVTDLISGIEAKIASVWKWEKNDWSVYLPGQTTGKYASIMGFEVLSTINPGEGFWVNCKDALLLAPACSSESEGNDSACHLSWLLQQSISQIVAAPNGTIFFYGTGWDSILRYDSVSSLFLSPITVNQHGDIVTKIAYSSSHSRLYVAHESGRITFFDVEVSNELQEFASTETSIQGLVAVGKFLLAQNSAGTEDTHYIFDAQGALTDSLHPNEYSKEYAWNETHSRVYYFSDGNFPNDLHYEDIDQSTGQIVSKGDTIYHGDYSVEPPIRVSTDGQYVLLGSGDIYNGLYLTWSGSIGTDVEDALWMPDGSLVTLQSETGKTILRRRDAALTVIEQLTYNGEPLGIFATEAGGIVVATQGDMVAFFVYEPNYDIDGDAVEDKLDAFPLDVTASVDSDYDGYPDDWNKGYGQADSTTGLILDSYPNDAACYLPEHGDGIDCDYDAAVPDYMPDQIVSDGDGIVYLLSRENARIYRWSVEKSAYINPFIVGLNIGLLTEVPSLIACSSTHNRLYLGYSNGVIRYIDLQAERVNQNETPRSNN